jgi:hypothetical protein
VGYLNKWKVSGYCNCRDGDIVDGESLKKIVFQTVKFYFTIMTKPLLSIQNLEISFKKEGVYSAVIKNISYDLQHNEILEL